MALAVRKAKAARDRASVADCFMLKPEQVGFVATRASLALEGKLLVGKVSLAEMLSSSERATRLFLEALSCVLPEHG